MMYGDGLDKLEQISVNIISDVIEDITKLNGEAFDPATYLQDATGGVISSLVSYCSHKTSPKYRKNNSSLDTYLIKSRVIST